MILFSSLEDLYFKNKKFSVKAVLKLTSGVDKAKLKMKDVQRKRLELVKKEADDNNFTVIFN